MPVLRNSNQGSDVSLHRAGRPKLSELPSPLTDAQQARRQQRRFIKEGRALDGALSWRGNRGRAKALRQWRTRVSKTFSARPRFLRVAWTLEWLFGKDGYAFPTDGFLANELGMDVDHVQEALKDLERGNAIIRASVFIDEKPQRRIWPSAALIPPATGGNHTPRQAVDIPPDARGQRSQEGNRHKKPFLSSTVLQARRAAVINQRRQSRGFEEPEGAA